MDHLDFEDLREEALGRRRRHWPRLDKLGEVYLDHAGAALPSEVLVRRAFADLDNGIFGNPHSAATNSSQTSTSSRINKVRERLLDLWKGQVEFDLIFTSGATASMKLLAESFPFASTSEFVTLKEVHTSVLGMRLIALAKGSQWTSLSEEALLSWHPTSLGPHLVAFPAQCNWSGTRFDVPKILANFSKCDNTFTFIDAAAWLGSSRLDLSAWKGVDFVALSFYKWLGFPTGLGCLLVRNSALKILRRTYFGGGTIESALASENWERLRPGYEGWEDGTPHFQGIASLSHALDLLPEVFPPSKSLFLMGQYLVRKLRSLSYPSGLPICKAYAWLEGCTEATQAATVAFNLLDNNGSYIGYSAVTACAQLAKISLRSGCFCNPGACQKYLGISNKDIKGHHAQGHICWDERDLIDNKPTGALRASIGPHNTFEDLDRLVSLVSSIASNQLGSSAPLVPLTLSNTPFSIESLTIYPIKSCHCFDIKGSWALSSTGLFLDREWALVDDSGTHLALKRNPSLIRIRATPGLKTSTLLIEHPGKKSLVLPLQTDISSLPLEDVGTQSSDEELTICGESVRGRGYVSHKVNEWFQASLGLPGIRLVRASQTRSTKAHSSSNENENGTPASIIFANEGQLLIIGTASLEDLSKRLGSTVSSTRFRPNLVIRTTTPYEEDAWKSIRIGDQTFTSIGPCSRCNTICLDEETLTYGSEPLQTLTSYRRAQGGRVLFGVLFDHVPSKSHPPFVLDPNSPVTIESFH